TPLAGEAPRIAWELGASGVGACVIAGARHRRALILRDDHLNDEELGAVEIGEERRPARRAVGSLRPVDSDHHASDRRIADERGCRQTVRPFRGEVGVWRIHATIFRVNWDSPDGSRSEWKFPPVGRFRQGLATADAPQSRMITGDQPQPLLHKRISTNCFPSGRSSPVIWLELTTQECSMPWMPRVAVVTPR